MSPVDAWVVLRFAKFVGVALFASGVVGSLFARDAHDRRRSAHVLATLGLIVVWVAGYGLAKAKAVSIGELWIARSLLAGLVAMFAAAWAATTNPVPRFARALGVGALVAAFGLMSTRGEGMVLNAIVPLAAAVAAGLLPSGPSQPRTEDDGHATFSWFAWLARAEGVSLVMLFGVYMPLKYAAGIVLDGGQGWFGWMHGVLQLLYLVALVVTSRALGWSVWRTAVGGVASLLPLGTFIFEARVRPN